MEREIDRPRYSSIRNMKELQQARERVKFAVALKEQELKSNKEAIMRALNPITYINRVITKIYSLEPLVALFTKVYDSIKGFFRKRGGIVESDGEGEGPAAGAVPPENDVKGSSTTAEGETIQKAEE